MALKFRGRSRLLGQLNARLDTVRATGSGQMLAVRGRRQVGKSTLFTRFVEAGGVPYLYFTAIKGGVEAAQMRALSADVVTSTSPLPDAETLFGTPSVDWRDAFGKIALAARDTPCVVVLDEFPWAFEADPSLEGVLQIAWDRQLQGLPVLFVLIGSDVAMMQRLTEHDRPLYGRPTHLRVGPFDPAECADSLGSGTTAFAAFDAFLVTGGYPRLVAGCARAGSADAFVAEQLGDENNDLLVMAQRSLAGEFPGEAQARRVISAIGAQEVGHAAFSQVVGRLHEGRSGTQTMVTRALGLLLDTKQVVAVERPVGAPPNTRLRRYRVDDPYLRFWFRFVEPHLADIARGRPDIARAAFQRDWSTWRGKAIEPVVHEAVRRLAHDHPVFQGAEDVGGWWNRQHNPEVDLVVATRGVVYAVGTVKWGERRRVTSADRDALTKARLAITGAQDAALVAVTPAGVRSGVDFDLVMSPDDLLSAWR